MIDYKGENLLFSKISNKAFKILIKIQLQCNSELREPCNEVFCDRLLRCPGTTETSLAFIKGKMATFTIVLRA